MDISFVVPLLNESDSLRQLFSEVKSISREMGFAGYEVIFVDDGSTDDSWTVLAELKGQNPDVLRAIRLRRNYGKSCALRMGFARASGKVVVTLDADLQDVPAELPQLYGKLQEGFDAVSGWRVDRSDKRMKKLVSKVYNYVTSFVTGVELHDHNTGFKCFRREALEKIRLYGDRHRYVPVLLHNHGFRVTEVPVQHRDRQYGKSRYGFERFVNGFLDLTTVMTLGRFVRKPAHFYGRIGLFLLAIGALFFGYLTFEWFFGIDPIGTRPLFLFSLFLMGIGVQITLFGLLAELLVFLSWRDVQKDMDTFTIAEI